MRISSRFATSAVILCSLLGGSQAFSLLPSQTRVNFARIPESSVLNAAADVNAEEKAARLAQLRASYGEKSRPYRRSYYQHDEWLKHRAYDRFFKNLATIFESGVSRQVFQEVAAVTLIASFVCAWNALFVTGFTDLNGFEHEAYSTSMPLLTLPGAPFSYSSPALGLLLVFRTNVAYARWDEARKAWGVIVNHSRNLLRQGASWVTEETEPDPELRAQALEFFCNSVWAFARSLQRHLWGEYEDDENFRREVSERLEPFEAEGLIKARHKPTRANMDLSRAINQLPLTYLRRVEIDKSAIEFANAMGACDRIFTSPVPVFYTRHTARFLGLWILLLPFALYEPFSSSWNHFGMIPASTIVSFFFFGIEELSVALEEPFSILPLDKIAGGIGLSADEHFDWHFEEGKTEVPSSSIFVSQQVRE